jgi:hypothetical protein
MIVEGVEDSEGRRLVWGKRDMTSAPASLSLAARQK